MRTILVRLPGWVVQLRILLLPLLALAVLLFFAGHPARLFLRTAHGLGAAGQAAMDGLRLQVEPAIARGGIMVSRNRNTIAGAMGGCGAGAVAGAASAAALAVVTGGAGLAAMPAGAGLGCLLGGASGAALGYPLDDWALTE